MHYLVKKYLKIALALLFIAGATYTLVNPLKVGYTIHDWYSLRTYNPPSEIETISQKAMFTEHGQRLFYVSQPELSGPEEFNANCPFPDLSSVLGCYDGRRIYLFDIDRTELEGVETVTAAHEMLHAAWARLSQGEKEKIKSLINKEYKKLNDQDLKDTIQNYKSSEGNEDPDLVPNELHSFIGTEYESISPELDKYYSKYFKDRSKVVSIYREYAQVYEKNEQRIKKLKAQIDSLQSRIDSYDSRLSAKRDEINNYDVKLQSRLSNNDTSGYNALVPERNRAVREYNALVRQRNSLVEELQKAVDEHNRLVIRQNELVKATDSKAQVIE